MSGERDEVMESRDLTLSSDADASSGTDTRDEPISFRESRERAHVSREAAESRGEPVDDVSVPDVGDGADVVESAGEEPASSESLESVVREALLDGSGAAVTLATGESGSMSYRFVRTTVDGERVFALLSSGMDGVAFSSSVEQFGTAFSTSSVSVEADAVAGAVCSARKLEKRRSRYRDESWYVSELSSDEAELVASEIRSVVSELLRSVVLMGEEERARRELQAEVVSGSVVVGGAGVGRCVRDRLEGVVSDAQVDAVVGRLPELIAERCEGACQSEVTRMETLTGGECVVAGQLQFE